MRCDSFGVYFLNIPLDSIQCKLVFRGGATWMVTLRPHHWPLPSPIWCLTLLAVACAYSIAEFAELITMSKKKKKERDLKFHYF